LKGLKVEGVERLQGYFCPSDGSRPLFGVIRVEGLQGLKVEGLQMLGLGGKWLAVFWKSYFFKK